MARFFTQTRFDNADPGVTTLTRRDRGVLRKPYVTPRGNLRAEGIGAVAGVHEYVMRGADGKPRVVRELLDDDVLRKDAGQIGGLPLLLLHRTDGKPSTPANLRKRRADEEPQAGDFAGLVGDSIDVVHDEQGGYVKLSIITLTDDARKAVDSGKAAELSFGYDVVVDATPGVHPVYGPYDQRQVSRRYDHLALVPQARHGSDARVRTDGEDLAELLGIQITPARLDALAASPTAPPPGQGVPRMTFLQRLALDTGIRLDGLTEEGLQKAILGRVAELKTLDDAVATLPRPEGRADMSASELVRDMCAKHEADMAGLKKQLSEMEAAKATAEGERDSYKADLDGYMSKEKEAEEQAKMDSLSTLADHLGVARKDGETDKDYATLRADCAKAILGGDVPEGYTDAHYEGLFLGVRKNLTERSDGKDVRYNFVRKTTTVRTDGTDPDAPKPRKTVRSLAKARRDANNGGN